MLTGEAVGFEHVGERAVGEHGDVGVVVEVLVGPQPEVRPYDDESSTRAQHPAYLTEGREQGAALEVFE